MWEKAGIRDPSLSLLKTMLKQNILAMNNMDLQRKEKHSEVLLKQKEMYIKHLESQVKVRDYIIEEHQSSITSQNVPVPEQIKRAMQEIQPLSEIATHSKVSFPDLYPEARKSEPLPTRIPKPTKTKNPPSVPERSNKKPRRRKGHRKRSNSVTSNGSETSTASSGARSEKHARALQRVAEKFQLSPYVVGGTKGKSIPPKETGRKRHPEPAKVKYGSALRKRE
jgi:hypothetical protein